MTATARKSADHASDEADSVTNRFLWDTRGVTVDNSTGNGEPVITPEEYRELFGEDMPTAAEDGPRAA